MNTCNKCQGKFTWAKPYTGDKVPSGDNPCTCDNHSAAPKPAGAPRVEVPIEQIVAEIIAIKGTMVVDVTPINTNIDGTTSTQGEAQIMPAQMTPEMVEGIWKFAISRKMSR